MSKTIVALDFSSKEEVVDFLKQFDEPVYVKIGMELTYTGSSNCFKKSTTSSLLEKSNATIVLLII